MKYTKKFQTCASDIKVFITFNLNFLQIRNYAPYYYSYQQASNFFIPNINLP